MSEDLKMTHEEALNLKEKLTKIFDAHADKAISGWGDDDKAAYGQSAAHAAQALIKLDEHALKMRLPVK